MHTAMLDEIMVVQVVRASFDRVADSQLQDNGTCYEGVGYPSWGQDLMTG
jgi:hypothetical protein